MSPLKSHIANLRKEDQALLKVWEDNKEVAERLGKSKREIEESRPIKTM